MPGLDVVRVKRDRNIAVLGVIAALVVVHARSCVMRVPAGLAVAAVEVSRLYLGVHRPTDVLGGRSVGALWLATCLTAYTRIHRPWHLRPPAPARIRLN